MLSPASCSSRSSFSAVTRTLDARADTGGADGCATGETTGLAGTGASRRSPSADADIATSAAGGATTAEGAALAGGAARRSTTNASTAGSFVAVHAGTSDSPTRARDARRSVPLRSWSMREDRIASRPFCMATSTSSIACASFTATSSPITRAAPLIECAARISGSTTAGSLAPSRRTSPSLSEAACVSASPRKSSCREKPPRSLT